MQHEQDNEGIAAPGGPRPRGRQCPSIDALTLYRVAMGELSLHLPITPVSAPTHGGPRPGLTLPLGSRPAGYNRLLQPNRHAFDAWAIYQISRHTHPWQAPEVQPLVGETYCGLAPATGLSVATTMRASLAG